MIKKSGQESGQAFPKSDSRYWKPRLFKAAFTRDGKRQEGAVWSVRIQHQGQREKFNLGTANRDAAATKAAGIFKRILAVGWATVLAELKPREPKKEIVTVGDFITMISLYQGETRQSTFVQYVRCLRRLAADVAGLDRSSLAKFDHTNGKSALWQAKIDAIKIRLITPSACRKWMHQQITGDLDPLQLQRRKIAANAVITKVRALWSSRRLKLIPDSALRAEVIAMDPTLEVDRFDEPDLSYRARFDPAVLLADAQKELPSRRPVWRAFVLSLFGGLRRKELDLLPWPSVDIPQGIIHVEPSIHFTPKSQTSVRQVRVPAEVQKLLKAWRLESPNDAFVIPSTRPTPAAGSRDYRCKPVFDELIAWLRGKGVDGNKPIHTLRKAAGDLINTQFGLLAASRFLGHSDTRITGKFYADGRGAVVGLGGVLNRATSIGTKNDQS